MILNQFKLDGKIAVVTGANRGLGQGIALALAEAGAKVLGTSTQEGEQTQALIAKNGGAYQHFPADLAKHSAAKEIIEAAKENFGTVDILVNNAGIIRRNDALDFTEEDWDAVMDVNLKAAFFLAQAAAKVFVAGQKRGKIINIASMLSFQGGIRIPSYTSSKSGLMGLTRLLACEWAKHGINVNAIAPGYMVTDNTAALRNDTSRYAEITNRIPAGYWGKPEDLGGAAVFLASEAANYIHGYTLAVDGGWLAR